MVLAAALTFIETLFLLSLYAINFGHHSRDYSIIDSAKFYKAAPEEIQCTNTTSCVQQFWQCIRIIRHWGDVLPAMVVMVLIYYETYHGRGGSASELGLLRR